MNPNFRLAVLVIVVAIVLGVFVNPLFGLLALLALLLVF